MADVYDQKTNKPRPDVLKQHFVGEGRLKPDVAVRIITDGAALFRQEKCLLEIPQPITGSVHSLFCLYHELHWNTVLFRFLSHSTVLQNADNFSAVKSL